MKQQHAQRGVTLIELMIVVVILAMIASFAYPSYMNYVVNTKRTAATSTLLQVADRQQQFFMDNKRYAAGLSELGYDNDFVWVDDQGNPVAAGDAESVYVIGLANVGGTNYLGFAAPLNIQLKHDGKCGAMTLDQSGKRNNTGTSDDCW